MTKQVQVQQSPLPALLFITFLVLKLTDVIDWSWCWVTAPLWIPLALLLVFLAFMFATAAVLRK